MTYNVLMGMLNPSTLLTQLSSLYNCRLENWAAVCLMLATGIDRCKCITDALLEPHLSPTVLYCLAGDVLVLWCEHMILNCVVVMHHLAYRLHCVHCWMILQYQESLKWANTDQHGCQVVKKYW